MNYCNKNGHKEAILCVAHCPPSLLATGSYDGEIIVWNVVSGRIQCRFGSRLSTQHQDPDTSVPSIVFVKNLQEFSSTPALLSSGSKGCLNLWSVLNGGKFVSSFRASKFQQKITKLAKADKAALLYAADIIGYIYVYRTEKFPSEQKSLKAENFWRAHTSTVTGLQIVDNDQVVLTSSADCTVRLWSARGKFIGTFGQHERWSVNIPSSWMHPGVPFEVLIDPLSLPDHKMSNVKTRRGEAINPDKDSG